jgi:hypothetical protein
MNKLLKYIGMLIALILISGVIPAISPIPVEAAGYTVLTIPVAATTDDGACWYNPEGTFSVARTPNTYTSSDLRTEIVSTTGPSNYGIYEARFNFNISGIKTLVAAGGVISSIKLRVYATEKGMTGAGASPYYFVTKGDNTVAGWQSNGYPHNRYSNPYSYSTVPTVGYFDFNLVDTYLGVGNWSYILNDTDNITYFNILDQYIYYNQNPYAIYALANDYWWVLENKDAALGHEARLVVTYAVPPAVRTMNILPNGTPYTGGLLGTENVTGVDWLTPRAAFADETIGFKINGSPGAAFSYVFSDGAGNLITSGNNTIWTEGYYYIYTAVPITENDWIRLTVRDTNFNQIYYSAWGRVELPPNITELNLTTSATDTAFPQYDNNFSPYVVYKNGVGIIYWKTNLVSGDMPNYSFKINAGGDNTATSFNATMSWLNTNYFQINDSANNAHSNWRYLMFTPFISDTNFNSRDGFIMNIFQDYTLWQTGFWESLIVSNTDNSTLAMCDTAYWYLNSIDQGISMTVQDTMSGDSLLNVIINIGNHSKVASRLANVNIQVIDSVGTVYGSSGGFVYAGANDISFPQPTTAGEYQARITFYDLTLVPDYAYIHDIQFKLAVGTVGTIPPDQPPTTSGFLAWLNALLESKGMNNAAGHWIIIILLCVLVSAIFGVYGKMPLVATVIDILIFGLAIYIKWVDTWIIALMAIAAGFTIYRMFKKNTGEQKEV